MHRTVLQSCLIYEHNDSILFRRSDDMFARALLISSMCQYECPISSPELNVWLYSFDVNTGTLSTTRVTYKADTRTSVVPSAVFLYLDAGPQYGPLVKY